MDKDKFAIIKTLDDWKWNQSIDNYMDEIDFYCFINDEIKEKLYKCKKIDCDTAIKILLTHHLVYICDRKMDYRYVCKAGGYVISKIVEDYVSGIVLDENGDFVEDKCFKEFDKFIEKHTGSYNDNGVWKHYLKADIPTRTDIKEYFESKNLLEKDFVKFSSYATVNDYKCIFDTIQITQVNSLGMVIACCDSINDLAKILFQITYKNGYILTGKNKEKFLDLIPKRPKKERLFEDKKFQLKRLWCVIRDFMYNPIFITCMRSAVGDEKYEFLKRDVDNIELPGDIWNNNSRFAKCFWNIDDKNFKSSKFVRENYNHNRTKWGKCLPINFDTTFNLAPRLCNNNSCATCLLSKYTDKKFKSNDYKKLCHKQKGLYCTFALYSAGIKHECEGQNCNLKNFFN